jgi:hypothetical protein
MSISEASWLLDDVEETCSVHCSSAKVELVVS